MTIEQNITAILETYFGGFKDELIEACVKRIMEQIERQADTPQTDCYMCKWMGDRDVCGRCRSRNLFAAADTPQKDCETCKHYGVVSVSCDRCDKSTYSKYEPQTDCGWGEVK